MLSSITGSWLSFQPAAPAVVIELDERQQVAPGHQRVFDDGAIGEVRLSLLPRVPVLHRLHAEGIAHEEVVLSPRAELRQLQQRAERHAIEGDRAGKRRLLPSDEVPVADVGDHHAVGGGVRGERIETIDLCEGRELGLPELEERLVDGRHFAVGRAVALAVAGEVLRHGEHAPGAACVHAGDVGSAQLADPGRVSAK